MAPKRTLAAVAALLAALALIPMAPAAGESWYCSPSLAVMTGYIYEPKSPYTIREWEKGLGERMDADRWVADFRQAGASYLIFYDKWIDGFVFHDTKTTGFKTGRNFVRQVSDACHRGDLRIVYYYNAISDGNPEFDQWSLLDRQGKPIVFSPTWPTRYQTLHSPFRKTSVEQLRELLTSYGRVDGVWLDIFGERLNTTSPWVARGYEKMFGEPFDQATPQRLGEFNLRTLAGYLDEVRAIARECQPECVWTSNGSAQSALYSMPWSRWVGSRLDYGSVEGHSFDRMDQLARTAWASPKPVEIGLLLCKSWFTPLEDEPPPASMTEHQAVASAAIALCQGASVYMALTPGHSGAFGDDLQRAKAVGAWFKAAEPVLRDARPYADVGIVLGSPSLDGPGLPARNDLWKWYDADQRSAWDEAIALSEALGRAGVPCDLLYDCDGSGAWPDSLAGRRAVLLPERALLDADHAERLRQYVRDGGTLVAFGHASMLDAQGVRQDDYLLGDVLGVHYAGEVAFPPRAHKTQVRTDSEYSPEFAAANLVDGRPTAWASAGTPMPHWAEIILPEPAEIARVELVSRPGPYLVTDVDVEAYDGSEWRLVGSARGADNRTISLRLEKPVRADKIRVKILRELYQSEDRQYADVEAVRIVDTAGRDVSTDDSPSVPVVPTAPDLQRALEEEPPLTILPMAVRVRPTTAEAIARLDDEARSPALLCNRFGRGEAILVTTSEASFHGSHPFWTVLRRLVIGEPTLACDENTLDRYRFILTRVGEGHVLHVIDRAAAADYEPAEITVSLASDRFAGLKAAALVGGTPVATKQEGGRTTLQLRPDPVASVVLP